VHVSRICPCIAHPSCIRVEGVSWRRGHVGSLSIHVACVCMWGILGASRVKYP
jgi:hypothetical protein